MKKYRYTVYMSLRTLLFVVSSSLFVFLPSVACAASLYIDPSAATYGPGDTFIATVRVDNEGDCINAINVALTYPKDTLRAVDFSSGDSIFSLWAVEPHIDTNAGTVVFAGGIPGGYCGRIAGDAALSNVLGEVVFSVISSSTPRASIDFSPSSVVYLNDGQGTAATLTTHGAVVTLSPTPLLTKNPWLAEVAGDTTPPQKFTVDVESTSGVFDGKYYIVFSTTDKESGLDHFEIADNGGWKRITSPYLLLNQSLFGVGDIQVRALDKAGNIRMGDYSATSTPPRQFAPNDFGPLILLGFVVLLVGIKMVIDRRKSAAQPPSA